MSEHVVKLTTTGGAGVSAASGSTEDVLWGYLEAIQVAYHASAPATTDVTATEASGMARVVLTLSNQNTTVIKYPRVQVHDTSGTALTLDGTRASTSRIYLAGVKLTIAVAQCDDLTNAVTARIQISEH